MTYRLGGDCSILLSYEGKYYFSKLNNSLPCDRFSGKSDTQRFATCRRRPNNPIVVHETRHIYGCVLLAVPTSCIVTVIASSI